MSAVDVVLLNELSLPSLVWAILRRRRPCVIPLPVIIMRLQPVLDRFCRYLGERGLIRTPENFDPGLAVFHDVPVPVHYADTFAVAEPWMERRFRFADADRHLGDDAMPFKQVTCNHVQAYFTALYFTRQLEPILGASTRLICPDPDFLGLYRAVHGAAPTFHVSAVAILRHLAGVVVAAGVLLATLVACLRSVGRSTPPQEVFLGSDFIYDERDAVLWRETAATGRSVLVVLRFPGQADRHAHLLAGMAWTVFGVGRLSPAEACRQTVEAVRRFVSLIAFDGVGAPGHLVHVAALPFRRLKVRRLLAKYRFRYFWGRDEYNVEHMLRSQELRRRGGTSLGISHGLPVAATVVPMWRYIDHDIYYLVGRHLHRYYSRTWPAGMMVKGAGSMGLTRERLKRLDLPRPRDIVFAAKPGRFADRLAAVAGALADSFPDRALVLQVKSTFRDRQASRRFVEQVTGGRSNVVVTTDPIYELFLRARYFVTDPSTTGAEAVQFGLASFILDLDDRKAMIFRDFPQMCVRIGEELVEKIRAIEAGAAEYRPEMLSELISLERRTVHDMVLEDMGLSGGDGRHGIG